LFLEKTLEAKVLYIGSVSIFNKVIVGNGMVMIRGFLEILQMANSSEPKSFNNFTKISITGRRLSSATVSKRLDELLKVKVIEEVVQRSKTGRRVIAYRATEKGKRVIEVARELEEAIAVPKRK
jgi:DNA-binding HxlR family transcriptional regulator